MRLALPPARVLRCTATLLLMLPTACTIVRPIPPAGNDLFFRAQAEPTAPDSCQQPDAPARGCLKPALKLDDFYGGLGEAIWEADLQRHELMRLGAERTNQNSVFNAMLWPVGAYVAARNLANPSASLLRDAGAFSLAAYGVLSSGVPERDKLYIEAARRLACAISLASGHLYANADIEATDAKAELRTVPRRLASLSATLEELDAALANYRVKRVAVLAKLRSRKVDVIAPAVAVERRASQLAGQSLAGGGAPVATIDRFAETSRQHQNEARKLRDSLSDIPDELVAAQRELGERTRHVKQRLDRALIARAPALSEPGATAAQMAAMLGRFAQSFAPGASAPAGAGRAQSGSAPWEVDERALSGLARESRDDLITFAVSEQGPANELSKAVDKGQVWLQVHRERQRMTLERSARNGCTPALLDETGPLRPPDGSASAPGSGAVRALEPR